MKKTNWLSPKGIIVILALVGALGGAIVVAANYITLPENVEANTGDIVDLKQIIRDQQTINDFYYKREQQQPYNNQRQQAPRYELPQERCWEWANDGYEYETDCEGNWL